MESSDTHTSNYSYFPILVGGNYPISRDELYSILREQNIFTRRYFHPLITEFPMYKALDSTICDVLPVARNVAKQVLCLPIYPDLSPTDVDRIADVISTIRR